MVSAVFHYLGPSFAVLLFARVDVLGVAWLRIASAAIVFSVWRRPWRAYTSLDRSGRRLLLAWGAVLAVMNVCFYAAIDQLPLGTVAAIEFLPVVALAALGARTTIAAESHQPDVLVQMVRLGLGWTVLPVDSPTSGGPPVVLGPQLVERVLVLARRADSISDPAADELARRLRA